MVSTIKFSQFGNINLNNSTNFGVGYGAGANYQVPATIIWTTAGRPTTPVNGQLGFNTNLDQYEYWSQLSLQWIAVAGGDTGTVTSVDTGTGLTGGPITSNGTISFAAIAAHSLWANTTGASAVPTVTALSTFLLSANNLSDLTNAATARTNIGLAIGVNVQAWSAVLDSIVAGTLPTSVQVGVNSLNHGTGASGTTFWRGDGTWGTPAGGGTINAGLINQMAWYAASGSTLSGLATAANGVLITSAGSVPSISSTLPTAVQGNITSLGTITSGIWNASIIPLAYGGTNANLTAANGAIVYSNATTLALLAPTSTANQMLQSGSNTAPSWSTSTWPANTTINQILYSSAANTVTGLLTANNGVLITSAGGVPSISGTLPAAVQSNITSLGTITSGVWQGSQIALGFGGTNAALTASNGGIVYSTATSLAILAGTPTAGQLLQSGASSAPSWTTASFPASAGAAGTFLRSDGTNWIASTLTIPNTIAINNLLYTSSSNTVAGLAASNSSTLATTSGGIPTWVALTNGQLLIGNTGATPTAATLTAGTGMSIVNAGGSITLNTTGGGLTWSTITAATLAATVNNAYILNHAATPCVMTLPASAVIGSKIVIRGLAGSGGWTATANSGQTIQFGNQASSTAGSWSSTDAGDGCDLECIVANTTWTLSNCVSSGLTKV